MENKQVDKEQLAERAFRKIDKKVAELFDQFVARDKLPTHNKHGGKIRCRDDGRGLEQYIDIYHESVEKAVELIKESDPDAFQALVDEHGSESKLISNFKFN
jgi:hypothetical protein